MKACAVKAKHLTRVFTMAVGLLAMIFSLLSEATAGRHECLVFCAGAFSMGMAILLTKWFMENT